MSTILSVLIPSMVSWHGSWAKLTWLEGLLRNDYCTIVAKFLTLTAFKCMPRRMLFRFSSCKPRVPERLGSRSKHTHLHPRSLVALYSGLQSAEITVSRQPCWLQYGVGIS